MARRALWLLLLLAVLPPAPARCDESQASPSERARGLVGASGYQAEIPEMDRHVAEACQVAGPALSGGSGSGGDVSRDPGGSSEAGGRRVAPPAPRSLASGNLGAASASAVAAVLQALALLLLVLFVLGVLFVLFQAVDRRRSRSRGGGGARAARADEAEVKIPPLEDVERLAAAGDFAAAAHLLLQHALRLLTRRAGARLAPSQTSREVLRGLRLGSGERDSLQTLVGAVENSFFGGRALDRGDYENCRSVFDSLAQARSTDGA